LTTLGLAWDVTNGVNIDLEASAICLDKDLIWSIKFGAVNCNMVPFDIMEMNKKATNWVMRKRQTFGWPIISLLDLFINFFVCQELDDVSLASCHLFDPKNQHGYFLAYALTNASNLNG
jgi:hypothetical protein